MLPKHFFSLFAICITMLPATGARAQQTEHLRKIQQTFTKTIRPMIEQNCGDCHWGDNADADLNLEPFETLDQLLDGREKWKKVLLRVAAKEMPPSDADPMPDDQHQQLMVWLDELMNSVDCTDITPGRVTIRRLNRVEYRNTVKDLVGVDYKPSRSFPGDDVGYGFDNIADVLSLPPILMEKYLQAAEEISFQAINDITSEQLAGVIAADDFTMAGKKVEPFDNSAPLYNSSTISSTFDFKETGKYKVIVEANGDQAGAEPCKMSVSIDRRQSKTVLVRNDRSRYKDYEFSFAVNKAGKHALQISFLNDYYKDTVPPEKTVTCSLVALVSWAR